MFFVQKQPRREPRTEKTKRGQNPKTAAIAATDFLLKNHRFLGEKARNWALVARKQ